MGDLTLALDIGGTKIAVGLVDADGEPAAPRAAADARRGRRGHLVGHRGAPHRRHGRRPAATSRRRHRVGRARSTCRAAPSVPINITAWQRFPIVDRVAAATGLPVRLGGDGLCMALGERWRGAGRDAQFLLGMVVSTGIGGGLVLDGAPYDGRTGNAGHVGHVVVDPDGGLCTCGGHGCVETVASGPHLARWARENGWDAPPEADAKELADAANAGDPVALRAFDRGATADRRG